MNCDEALAAALAYAARGWSVLSLCPPNHQGVGRSHRGCCSPGKRPFFPTAAEPASGEWKEYQARRAKPDEIRAWFDRNPRINVGVALGPVSELVGIDVDDEDGDTLLAELAGGDLPPTWEYTTGKGRRLLYRLPPGVVVVNQAFRRPGTEIEILRFMSQGGQVVLPPSVHPNGSVYRWKEGRSPDDGPAADVPAWLRGEAKREGGTATRPTDGELITEGGRNNYLISLAGAMRKRGADEGVIAAALHATNESRFDPPLETSEVDSVARSAVRYAADAYTAVTMRLPGEPAPADLSERKFKWASELSALPRADEWIWHGYLPKGAITLLSALWKSGKTTLLSHLLKACAAGGEFLGQPIRAARVLYVSEEGEQHWVRRRDDLALSDNVGFYLQPFGSKPDLANWDAFIGRLVTDAQKHGFDLVVFDTLAKLWPVVEENDAGAVDAALMPLWKLTKAGVAVLLIHHLRKSGGQEYTGSRGSGALSAFPDIIVELTRFDAGNVKDRKRKLCAKGRYDETPDELVIELRDGAYLHVPDPGSSPVPAAVAPDGSVTLTVQGGTVATEEQRVLHVLQTSLDVWLQIEDIRALLKSNQWGMRNVDLNTHLFSLYGRGQVVMRGELRSPVAPRKYAAASRSTPGSVSGNDSRERPPGGAE